MLRLIYYSYGMVNISAFLAPGVVFTLYQFDELCFGIEDERGDSCQEHTDLTFNYFHHILHLLEDIRRKFASIRGNCRKYAQIE